MWQRIIATIFIFGLIGVGWAESWRFLDNQQSKHDEQSVAAVPDLNLPPAVVEMDRGGKPLPGISLHMSIRLINHSADRRKYLIDYGHVDGSRFSVHLSSDNVFTLMFVDNKKEPHPVQIPLGGDGIPLGRFFYLGCELGIGGNITVLRILIDGKEARSLELPFKTDLGELDVPGGVIGADLNGTDGAWFDIAEKLVLSETVIPQKLTAMKEYFDGRPHNVYLEFRGNQWMQIQQTGNAIQEDTQHSPIFRDER